MFWPRMNTFRRSTSLGNPLEIFDRVFDNTLGTVASSARPVSPAFNMWSDENGAVLTSELPGVSLSDLEITVSGRQVRIASARHEELAEGQRRLASERVQGSFERSFALPFAVDSSKVTAKLANGVLEVEMPRAESDKPRKILINGV